MVLHNATRSELTQLATELGFDFTEEELQTYQQELGNIIGAYNVVADTPVDEPPLKYPRTEPYRPDSTQNPYNAWYYRTSVKGAPQGKLAGRTLALKDHIALAGVPLMNGASVLEGYVPEVDAEVATRILDAGGEILGKAVCEYFCVSAGSHTSATGPVQNPYKHGHTTGGSSSGCAALVASGAVEMAIGGDQGGSIRVPASFCGIYGMKPTFGLVPYTGCMPLDMNVDHIGPMTQTVEDNALLLEVIAGSDGIDPRQRLCTTSAYRDALGKSVSGLRIAMIEEGFSQDGTDPAVKDKVLAAAEHYTSLGATVEQVSVPMHLMGPPLFIPSAVKNFSDILLGRGGHNTEGQFVLSMVEATARWRERPNELPHNVKLFLLAGQYLQSTESFEIYAKAKNLSNHLRNEYNKVLSEYDLLLMPTTITTAPQIPPADAPCPVVLQHAMGALANTMQFDLTGHPAMSIPCGMIDGLPVGMMLIGKHLDESTIYRAAHAFEQGFDWKSL